MKILFASSEVAPFSKTGGLADVGGSLPVALRKLGVEVIVVTPAYRQVYESGLPLQPTNMSFDIPISGRAVTAELLQSTLPESDVPIYFIKHDPYFDRPELYRENDRDYPDNCERFVFFCRAVLDCVALATDPVDLVHCNDWQCGLIPAYLRLEYNKTRGYERVASLMTIHNMAYQGIFWHWDMLLTGLDWRHFNWRQMEFYDQLNLLKTGIVFADAVSTVSPQYAREIQQSPHGCGLEGVLRHRADALSGILNGIDDQIWNPATDPHLAQQYDVESWPKGKPECKRALQIELGLPATSDPPLIGLVGRLAEQKGWELILTVMERWLDRQAVQWVVLGTGDQRYQDRLLELARLYPHRLAVRLDFSDPLAHRIEAGADLFLMPSRFEPCGLNQMYSLRYGTVPVVRATGGLADTIVDANPSNLVSGGANGFVFESYDADSLETALERARHTYLEQSGVWRQLIENGMRQDWSWERSAREYLALYERICRQRR